MYKEEKDRTKFCKSNINKSYCGFQLEVSHCTTCASNIVNITSKNYFNAVQGFARPHILWLDCILYLPQHPSIPAFYQTRLISACLGTWDLWLSLMHEQVWTCSYILEKSLGKKLMKCWLHWPKEYVHVQLNAVVAQKWIHKHELAQQNDLQHHLTTSCNNPNTT